MGRLRLGSGKGDTPVVVDADNEIATARSVPLFLPDLSVVVPDRIIEGVSPFARWVCGRWRRRVGLRTRGFWF